METFLSAAIDLFVLGIGVGGVKGNDRMLGLCVGRSYCDNGNSRWNL